MSDTYLEKIANDLEDSKEMEFYNQARKNWLDEYGEKNTPLAVVRKFIMDKGLKLYGGLALDEHLKKHKDPIYKRSEFPDYDVFSPNAWEHAKELCDILYKLGYYFVEAKSSTLNNEHHQTYKVSVDTIYILDLTQSGCTPREIEKEDCKHCGETKNNKCFSLFNHIPCIDLKKYNVKSPQIHRKTYNFEKNHSYFPSKMFVCEPEWLKISMYRELTEPMSNPARLVKVASRLNKFSKYFKSEPQYLCDKVQPVMLPIPLKNKYVPVLDFVEKFVNKKKLIHYGTYAYNFYVKNKLPQFEVQDFEVYSDNLVGAFNTSTEDSDVELLLKALKEKFKGHAFKYDNKMLYWKEIDINNFCIYVRLKGHKKYHKLITFTEIMECMPYVQYNRVRYATVDRMKHIIYRGVVLPKIIAMTDTNFRNYECMLTNLLKLEKLKKKSQKKSKTKRDKLRRFVKKCEGAQGFDKMVLNRLKMFSKKIDIAKETDLRIDTPRKGFITKIYPMPEDNIKFPYKPVEQEIKSKKNKFKKMPKRKTRIRNKDIL